MMLYHGSKGGIKGAVHPSSRSFTDFGTGCYLGADKEQAWRVPHSSKDPHYYTVELDMTGLRHVNLTGGSWAVFVAYCRGYDLGLQDTMLGESCKLLLEDYDIISGPIADDRMAQVFTLFMQNIIPLGVLIRALDMMSLGTQYCLKTQRDCDRCALTEAHDVPISTTGMEELDTRFRNFMKLNSGVKGVVVDDLIRRFSGDIILSDSLRSAT